MIAPVTAMPILSWIDVVRTGRLGDGRAGATRTIGRSPTVTTRQGSIPEPAAVQCIETVSAMHVGYSRDVSAACVLRRGGRRAQLHSGGGVLWRGAAHAVPPADGL